MLVGCDLHEKSLVLQVTYGAGVSALKRFENSRLLNAGDQAVPKSSLSSANPMT
jgi:hypothetical protein